MLGDFDEFDEQQNEKDGVDLLEDTRGHTVRDWICMTAPRNQIKKMFSRFLRTFTNPQNKRAYKEKIVHMCEGELI